MPGRPQDTINYDILPPTAKTKEEADRYDEMRWAIKTQNSNLVRKLLKKGTNPNITNRNGMLLLGEAFYRFELFKRKNENRAKEFLKIIKLLIEFGASVDFSTKNSPSIFNKTVRNLIEKSDFVEITEIREIFSQLQLPKIKPKFKEKIMAHKPVSIATAASDLGIPVATIRRWANNNWINKSRGSGKRSEIKVDMESLKRFTAACRSEKYVTGTKKRPSKMPAAAQTELRKIRRELLFLQEKQEKVARMIRKKLGEGRTLPKVKSGKKKTVVRKGKSGTQYYRNPKKRAKKRSRSRRR